MNLTVFANSTLYTPMPDENTTLAEGSTLDYLREEYSRINGLWLNGLTVITVKNILSEYLRERHFSHWVILNLGTVECYSHPSKSFLYWCTHYLNFYGCDALFSTFILPKMSMAARDIIEDNKEYFQTLSENEFAYIFNMVLKLLEGFSVIVVGVNKPNTENKRLDPHWLSQAEKYNAVIANLVSAYNINYIDSWNKYANYVVDTTHLTPEGHLKMFQEIQSIIRKGKN